MAVVERTILQNCQKYFPFAAVPRPINKSRIEGRTENSLENAIPIKRMLAYKLFPSVKHICRTPNLFALCHKVLDDLFVFWILHLRFATYKKNSVQFKNNMCHTCIFAELPIFWLSITPDHLVDLFSELVSLVKHDICAPTNICNKHICRAADF